MVEMSPVPALRSASPPPDNNSELQKRCTQGGPAQQFTLYSRTFGCDLLQSGTQFGSNPPNTERAREKHLEHESDDCAFLKTATKWPSKEGKPPSLTRGHGKAGLLISPAAGRTILSFGSLISQGTPVPCSAFPTSYVGSPAQGEAQHPEPHKPHKKSISWPSSWPLLSGRRMVSQARAVHYTYLLVEHVRTGHRVELTGLHEFLAH